MNINSNKVDIASLLELPDNGDAESIAEDEQPTETIPTECIPQININPVRYESKIVPRKPNGSFEDAIERRARFQVLASYRHSSRFAKYLADNGFDMSLEYIKNLSIDDLDQLIADIRYTISLKNKTLGMAETTLTGIAMIEPFVSMLTPLKVDGLSLALSREDKFLDLIEEYALENQSLKWVGPEYNLMLVVMKTALVVNQTHKRLENMSPDEIKKEIDAIEHKTETRPAETESANNLGNKYKDLLA